MSNDPAVRTLRLPLESLGATRIPRTRQPARGWVRVHLSRHGAVHFSRKEFHRFSHPRSPYALLCLGSDIPTCLFERFGDEMYDQRKTVAESLWQAHSVSS